MKLVRFGSPGEEKPGVIDADGQVRSLESHVEDVARDALSRDSLSRLRALNLNDLPVVQPERLGPCVAGVGKIICIGLNYADHAAESGLDLPPEPVIFMKATSSITGPNDPVVIPRNSKKTDWEVELAVVIGTRAKYVEKSAALDYVAGYCVMNDVSEREYQIERAGQWTKGKSCDTFSPLGPWLVTSDEVSDPQDLKMWLEVDGHRYQDSSTKQMAFGVAHLVSYLSNFMSLHPGDVISTGTPPGVGLGLDPPTYLKPGQTMRLGIEGLGEQQQVTEADC